jgi:ribonuclease P protein component
MPPSLRRLRKRPEFLRVARARRSWATPGLILQARRQRPEEARAAAPAGASDQIGVGFTASRKVGSAVERNRARRRLRAVAREILPAAGRPGYDYVLIARAGTLGRPYIELARDLKTALAHVSAEPRRPGRRREGKTGRT